MRESYFASDVKAIVTALEEGDRARSTYVNRLLDTIQENLEDLLSDEQSPEREWRQRVASSLGVLSGLMRKIGKPTPGVEVLASELAF